MVQLHPSTSFMTQFPGFPRDTGFPNGSDSKESPCNADSIPGLGKYPEEGQGASRAAPGKSGLHARGEGERVLATSTQHVAGAHPPGSWLRPASAHSPTLGQLPLRRGPASTRPSPPGDVLGADQGCGKASGT